MIKLLPLCVALALIAPTAIAEKALTTQQASASASGEWHTVIAEPNLVVRSKPAVTGEKLGNIPHGGKIKVIEKTDKTDSIGGRDGVWVKIEWQDTTGYAFDAFLAPLDAKDSADLVAVPDLTSDCVMEAETLLKSLGLRAKEISVHGPIDDDAAGIACPYRQSPKAGTMVNKGTTVTFRS
ncbi:MAG: SH3 domain-containing protein, partial [Thiothrix litoralis]